MFLATAMKRKANNMNDASYKISAKKIYIYIYIYVNDKKKVEKENDNGVKYNFVKKKSNFTNKSNCERVAKHWSTDEGREKYHVDEINRISESCKTPEGKEKHCADERNRMSESCQTPEGKDKYCADERSRISKFLKTLEGKDINREWVGKLLKTSERKEKNCERVAKTCETYKGIEKHRANERSRISKTRKTDKNSIEKAFIEVREESTVDLSILHTDTYEIISSN